MFQYSEQTIIISFDFATFWSCQFPCNQTVQGTIEGEGGGHEVDQNWLCSTTEVPTLMNRVVGISRMSRHTNMGEGANDVKFFILVLCPTNIKGMLFLPIVSMQSLDCLAVQTCPWPQHTVCNLNNRHHQAPKQHWKQQGLSQHSSQICPSGMHYLNIQENTLVFRCMKGSINLARIKYECARST